MKNRTLLRDIALLRARGVDGGGGSGGDFPLADRLAKGKTADNTDQIGAILEGNINMSLPAGKHSHAEGDRVAYVDFSDIGRKTPGASGRASHAENYATIAEGDNSHAEGDRSCASGVASHSEGSLSAATGDYAHVEGNNTRASGSSSHAEGSNTVSSGYVSHAEGVRTTASGQNGSHSEGSNTTASGIASHAEGYRTSAGGGHSHAEGSDTFASGTDSHAEGCHTQSTQSFAHAEGNYTQAMAMAAHAEGANTTASATNAHAEGSYSVASGNCAHAEGSGSNASGSFSHAEGNSTIANHAAQHVFGEYNIADTSTALASTRGTFIEIVGNGTYNSATTEAIRSNARTLDWDGNEKLAGSITLGAGTNNETTLTPTKLSELLSGESGGGVEVVDMSFNGARGDSQSQSGLYTTIYSLISTSRQFSEIASKIDEHKIIVARVLLSQQNEVIHFMLGHSEAYADEVIGQFSGAYEYNNALVFVSYNLTISQAGVTLKRYDYPIGSLLQAS